VKLIATTLRSRARGAVLLSSLGVLSLAIGLSGIAGAATNPVSGGTTTLDLKAKGVKVKATAPATKSGKKSVTLQNTGGDLDPVTGAGTVETSGGFKLTNENGKVKVSNVVITFGANGEVNAKVGKKTLDLATITGGTAGRNGFDGTVTGATMKLTKKGAKALNKPLAGSKGPFKKKLGTAGTTTVFSTLEVLAEGETKLIADTTPGGALAKFQAHGVSAAAGGVAPVGDATIDPATLTFSFPITGGTLSPTLDRGRMSTGGGVKITKTDPRPASCDSAHPVGVFLQQTDQINDFASKTIVGTATIPGLGTTPGVTLGELDMSGAVVTTDPTARTVTASGIVVRLTEANASTLNQIFGTSAEGCNPPAFDFAAGDALGELQFTAHLG
jgi:hypothetical protein